MEFLLEINTEEMPAAHIKAALQQLSQKIGEGLAASNVSSSQIKTYGTSRRLVVVGSFAQEQKDRVEDIIGPPKTVAFNEDGDPTPAAFGFAKKNGVSIQNLVVIKTGKGDYMGVRKIVKGMPTQDILVRLLPHAISSLTFPKMMRWGENTLRFSRPIKTIFCMFAEKPLIFSLGGISSCAYTTGHKIFSPSRITAKNFSEYRKMLANSYVLVDQDNRKQAILKQIDDKLAPLDAQVLPDMQLLEKLTYDVEFPYVFVGQFPDEYLKLPIEVLSTAMREGQNLFSVVKGKKQLPYFVGVADVPEDKKTLIQKGNERVLKARLEDAKFFWEQDLKVKLSRRFNDLEHVVYQEKLGSYKDKAQRLKRVVAYLSNRLDEKKQKKQAVEAAELCKVDLLTDMVREFSSLQGRMGGLYVKEAGYPAEIWKAVYEHYQPMSMEDDIPSSFNGALLSIADKLDSIVGAMGMGVEVSGSKDPFGLRRNAQGVCRIILEKKLSFSFFRLLDKVLQSFGEIFVESKVGIKNQCVEFFRGRLQYIFENQGFRYDLVNAAIAPGIENIYFAGLRLNALDNLKESAQFEPMILIAKRVNNILREQPPYRINSAFFHEKQERELYTTFSIIRDNVQSMISGGNFANAQRMLFRIKSSIHSFFDHVLVMDKDRRIRRNRLALLQAIQRLLMQIADYSQIVID
ncbi:MAG: glycine--tRNA ligase subunit beta [Candidatus Aminicenantes bacterium]|nr:glycine--tRNA ligase subunit beta [Candidatus Aminicenantes bacterium]